MIARTWSGRTRREDAETYLEVVRETGLSDIAKTPGNQGAWLLRRELRRGRVLANLALGLVREHSSIRGN